MHISNIKRNHLLGSWRGGFYENWCDLLKAFEDISAEQRRLNNNFE
jgi:hypothetical protein